MRLIINYKMKVQKYFSRGGFLCDVFGTLHVVVDSAHQPQERREI